MPKSSGRSSSASGANVITRDHGRLLTNLTYNANGGSVFPCQPDQMGQRLLYLSDAFGNYRFTRLRFTIYPKGVENAHGLLIGPTDLAATQVTSAQVPFQCAFSQYLSSTQTTPVTMEIPPGALRKGQQPWYLTEGSNASADSEVQCTLISYYGTVSTSVYLAIDYTIEFCDPVSAALVPRPLSALSTTRRLNKIEEKLSDPLLVRLMKPLSLE